MRQVLRTPHCPVGAFHRQPPQGSDRRGCTDHPGLAGEREVAKGLDEGPLTGHRLVQQLQIEAAVAVSTPLMTRFQISPSMLVSAIPTPRITTPCSVECEIIAPGD